MVWFPRELAGEGGGTGRKGSRKGGEEIVPKVGSQPSLPLVHPPSSRNSIRLDLGSNSSINSVLSKTRKQSLLSPPPPTDATPLGQGCCEQGGIKPKITGSQLWGGA